MSNYQPDEMVWTVWAKWGGVVWRQVRYVRATEDGKHVIEGGGHQLVQEDEEVCRAPPPTHEIRGEMAGTKEYWGN